MKNINIYKIEYVLDHVDDVVKTIQQEGLIIIKKVFSIKECDLIKNELDKTLNIRLNKGHYCGNNNNQVLDNYFMDNRSLLKLIYQEVTDKLMRILIDEDYVLISPSARNRRILNNENFGDITSGHGWHTDARYVGGKGVKPSLSYMAIACIDSFTKNNGCTHYVTKSHLLNHKPKNREEKITHEYLVANRGDLVILDTALWHKVGDASEISRWGVFNTYGPWFMKPYHRFTEMFNEKEIRNFEPIIRQLLHYDSNPPKDHNESMITLRRIRKLLENNEN